MGLFDRWRRKKKKEEKSQVKGREIMRTSSTPSKAASSRRGEDLTPEQKNEVSRLLAEYQRLVQRREELQRERGELTQKLDRGELTAIEFRKELMSRIQEASQVSESLRETSARLTSLGHPGVVV